MERDKMTLRTGYFIALIVAVFILVLCSSDKIANASEETTTNVGGGIEHFYTFEYDGQEYTVSDRGFKNFYLYYDAKYYGLGAFYSNSDEISFAQVTPYAYRYPYCKDDVKNGYIAYISSQMTNGRYNFEEFNERPLSQCTGDTQSSPVSVNGNKYLIYSGLPCFDAYTFDDKIEVFPIAPHPVREAVTEQNLKTVMTEVIGMIPYGMALVVFLVGFQKGWRALSTVLHKA